MSIREKPQKEADKLQTPQNEQEVIQLIEKGGSVANESKRGRGSDEIKNVQLRAPVPLLEQIDQSLVARGPFGLSRHAWLLQACYEKLKRDQETSG